MSKNLINKIVFQSGRTEVCSDILKVPAVTNKTKWEEVVVTYSKEDTYGLEKVEELSLPSPDGRPLPSHTMSPLPLMWPRVATGDESDAGNSSTVC